MRKKRYIIAITGASGAPYAKSLIQELSKHDCEIHVVCSSVAKQVWQQENEEDINVALKQIDNTIVHNIKDLGAPIASGSFQHDGMIIIPCSVKTLSAVASGYASNLIERSADVCLKERYPLVLTVRETPLSSIHLENMQRVTQAGGIILPASPGFYHGDLSYQGLVNFVVGKSLDALKVENNVFKRWKNND